MIFNGQILHKLSILKYRHSNTFVLVRYSSTGRNESITKYGSMETHWDAQTRCRKTSVTSNPFLHS